MNTYYTLMQNLNVHRFDHLMQIQNKSKNVLFALGVALNISVSMYMGNYKDQQLAQVQAPQNIKDLTQIASQFLEGSQNKEKDYSSNKQIKRTSEKQKQNQQESNQKDGSLILSLKQLLLQAKRRESKDNQFWKQNLSQKSIRQLLQEDKIPMDSLNTIDRSDNNLDQLLILQNYVSLAMIPAPIISHKQIDEKRRNLISRNVDTQIYKDKNCLRQQKKLKIYF